MSHQLRLPPGPRIPSVAQLAAYGRDAARFLEKCRRRYGPIFRLRFPLQPTLVVLSDAAAIDQLLRIDPEEIPPYPANHAIKSIFGPDSLLFRTAELHRHDRSLLTPHLSSEASLQSRELIRQQLDFALREFEPSALKVYPWAYRLTLRTSLMLFWGCQDADLLERIKGTVDLSRARYDSHRNMVLDTLAMSPREYPFAARIARILQGNRRAWLRQQFTTQIREQAANIRESPHSFRDCPFVARLAEVAEDTAIDDTFVDFAMTLLIAAYDPPAATISWLLLQLARSRELQRQIRGELASGSGATASPMLDACIKEVYRLYPPLHSITRTLTTATELAGFALPAGSFILPSIYLLHREPCHWEAPHEFRPDRFLGSQRSPTLHDGYLPFGASTRICPGRHFATAVLRTVIAEVLSRFELTTAVPVLKPPRTLGPTLIPDSGMTINCKPINEPQV